MSKLDKYAGFGKMSLHEEGDWVLHSEVKDYANQRVIEELENAKSKFPSVNKAYTDSIFDKLIKKLKQ